MRRAVTSQGGLGVDYDGYRAIVDQRYLHIGAKSTGGHWTTQIGLQLLYHFFVKGYGLPGPGGLDKGGTVTFLCSGMKCKLADKEDTPAGILYRAVHEAGLVTKNAHLYDLFAQPGHVGLGIGSLYAQQYQQALRDAALGCAVDAYRCF